MEVTITLDIVRRLRFDTNALADADQLLRADLFEVLAHLRLADMRILLWAGLKWEDRRLTLERVGELMEAEFQKKDGLKFLEMGRVIYEALAGCGPFGPPGNAETEMAAAQPLSVNGLLRPSAPPTGS